LLFDKLQTLRGSRPLILGHRGSPRTEHENTLASFERALADGADGIELDVRCTADKVLVVHHDETLSSGEVLRSHAFSILSAATRANGYELAKLEDVLALAAGRGFVNLEIKEQGFEEQLVQMAERLLPPDTFALSSFSQRLVWYLRTRWNVPVFLIVEGDRELALNMSLVLIGDASGIAYESSHITEDVVKTFIENRLPIFAWTVNDLAEARQLADWGLTGLITDIPGELKRALT
jgi:glycerophosphoryl diester phosphodiesterase